MHYKDSLETPISSKCGSQVAVLSKLQGSYYTSDETIVLTAYQLQGIIQNIDSYI